jgi:primosomal protein N' (replication factor Y)
MVRGPLELAGWWVIGPAPAPVARVAGRSRWQVLLHGPASPDAPWTNDGLGLPLPPEASLRRILPQGVSLTIDPDPLEL